MLADGICRSPIRTGLTVELQKLTGLSPVCELDFLAARARSTKNAAGAQISAPQSSGYTRHSCSLQQFLTVALQVEGLFRHLLTQFMRAENHCSCVAGRGVILPGPVTLPILPMAKRLNHFGVCSVFVPDISSHSSVMLNIEFNRFHLPHCRRRFSIGQHRVLF